MAVPLKLQLFGAQLGMAEAMNQILLPDVFASEGTQNVYIDKYARVASVLGYERNNTNPFVTDTGGSDCLVRGLIPYRSTSGGIVNRKLLIVLDDEADEWEIHVSIDNGASKTFLYDAGSAAVGQVPDWAQFGDNLYITNGKVAARKYNGTTISGISTTQSPTPTATENANAGLLDGNYRYKLVSVFSDASRKAGSAASTNTLVALKKMDIAWTADADTTVTGYELYRTTGVGTTYYFLAAIDGRTTVAYLDNTADTTLESRRVLEEHGDVPPVTWFCEPHKQRMWWLRTDTYPTRGYWSDPGKPEYVYANNYLDFSDSESIGDFIIGAIGNYAAVDSSGNRKSALVVFTERSIWTVTGSGAVIGDSVTDWEKSRTNAQVGAVSHRSIVRLPAGVRYVDQVGNLQTTSVATIAYFTPYGDIRLFDGDSDVIASSALKDTLLQFNYEARDKIHCVHDTDREQVIWFFPKDCYTEPSHAAVWSYRFGVWYLWTEQWFSSSVALDTIDDPHVMLTGEGDSSVGALVYTYFTGYDFDDETIDAVLTSKILHGRGENGEPLMTHTKRWRWVDMMFDISSSNLTVHVEILPEDTSVLAAGTNSFNVGLGYNQVFSGPPPTAGSNITSSNGSHIVVPVWATSAIHVKQLLFAGSDYNSYFHHTGVKLRVRSSSQDGGWTLKSYTFAYQVLPGLNRRLQ